MDTPTFVSGLELCESFFVEAVAPIMQGNFAELAYSAALIGNGSEVLGYDTPMSSDHHWGPRVMLFLRPQDYAQYKSPIADLFSHSLPRLFRGYPTGFTAANEADHGTRLLDYSESGPINHRIEIDTIAGFFQAHLDFDIASQIEIADWLTFAAQKLLTVVAGRVFRDQIGLEEQRRRFAYYPHEVWLYLLAAGWNRIEQEEHLMGRAGSVDDEIGSAIIASRLVRDLMRLCFLMERRYEPYPKWFGTAFSKLSCAPHLVPLLTNVLHSSSWRERETHLVEAYEYVAGMHNALAITPAMPTKAQCFFDRPFMVISMGAFSRALVEAISDEQVKKLAHRRLIGNIDQISDSTDILSDPVWRSTLRQLYL